VRKAKSFGLIASVVVLWISLVAFPALHGHFQWRASRAETQGSVEPGLFVPLLGAWALPESPILRISPREDPPRHP
jgi:hypothetical protein